MSGESHFFCIYFNRIPALCLVTQPLESQCFTPPRVHRKVHPWRRSELIIREVGVRGGLEFGDGVAGGEPSSHYFYIVGVVHVCAVEACKAVFYDGFGVLSGLFSV